MRTKLNFISQHLVFTTSLNGRHNSVKPGKIKLEWCEDCQMFHPVAIHQNSFKRKR